MAAREDGESTATRQRGGLVARAVSFIMSHFSTLTNYASRKVAMLASGHENQLTLALVAIVRFYAVGL